ncbi:toprim domain-containing protein [Nocardioides pacificus]
MSDDDFEMGHELDRALRAAVTGVAQVMERYARSSADKSRAMAARAREEWLEQRDAARRGYLPLTQPGAVEKHSAQDASKAWAAAAAWSTMDPIARDAEQMVAKRIVDTHGEHPSVLLHKTDLSTLPSQPPATKLLTMPEVVDLAGKHAPFYYDRHAGVKVSGDLPVTDAEKRLHEDWQHFAEHGELAERSRWEAWAAHAGEPGVMDLDNWRTPDGEVDSASRDSELARVWDEGADERGLRELEEHQAAMATAGMGDLREQVAPGDRPTWLPLLEQGGFDEVDPTEAARAWRDARAQGATGDLAAQAAAAQLAEQIQRKFGRDPNTYLLDAMTDRSAANAEARRTAEDKARHAGEATTPVSGLDGNGETLISLGKPAGAAAAAAAPGEGAVIGRERVLELNDQAQAFFSANLRPGTPGQSYLVERLGEDVLQGPWALGYAPPGWTRLTDHLRRNGASDEEIVGAGLGRVSSRGNVIDAFRDRAMVGIRNPDGELVGFVGRDLSGDERAPKYTNTGATAAFTKSQQVFGIHEAGEGARLVRTEGPFDAMATSLAGDGQAAGVAPLGTAMSDAQAAILAEHSADGRVWLANDTDTAGQAATENDFYALANRGVDARVVDVPGGDPAEAWQQNPVLLRSALGNLDEAPSAGEIVLERFIDTHREDLAEGHPGAQRELEAAAERVAEVTTDPVEAQLIRARPESLREELVRRSDDARSDAVAMDVASDQLGGAAKRADDPEVAEQLAADAAAVAATSDLTDAAGDDLEDLANKQSDSQSYDRATESDLDSLNPATRDARIASGHGYSQPTEAMVKESARGGRPGQAARRNRGNANEQGRGRGLRR